MENKTLQQTKQAKQNVKKMQEILFYFHELFSIAGSKHTGLIRILKKENCLFYVFWYPLTTGTPYSLLRNVDWSGFVAKHYEHCV